MFSEAAKSLRASWKIPVKPPRALLLYENDNDCELLRSVLTGEGYAVDECPLDLQTAAPVSDYCLVLFDVQRLTGRFLNITRAWRDEASGTTLIIVGNRTTQANRVALLESGVNAYLAKPLVVAETPRSDPSFVAPFALARDPPAAFLLWREYNRPGSAPQTCGGPRSSVDSH